MASVQEIADPFVVVVISLRLGEFVVVVRELQIDSATVDVHAGAQYVTCHDTAFNVPPRAT